MQLITARRRLLTRVITSKVHPSRSQSTWHNQAPILTSAKNKRLRELLITARDVYEARMTGAHNQQRGPPLRALKYDSRTGKAFINTFPCRTLEATVLQLQLETIL